MSSQPAASRIVPTAMIAATARVAWAALIALVALVAVLMPAPARAQAAADVWPSRPLKLVSPFNPGGAIDVLNRVIAEKLAARLGQPVVVDPIPGANTIKGAEVVARAPGDGYTFMITTMSTHVNNTVLYAKLPYDPARDFTPITQLSLGSVLLVARADAPFSDLPGFARWVQAQNRPVTYGSWGIGSSAHVYGEILRKDFGLNLLHVPYKGEVPAITDMRGGSLDVTFASPVGAKPQLQAGTIKAIAMTGPRRSAALPDLPTFAEQGFKGFELAVWVAAYAPPNTPRAIVDRLQRELATIVRMPDVAQRMIDQGQTPVAGTPEEVAAAFNSDAPRWIEYIRASGARAD